MTVEGPWVMATRPRVDEEAVQRRYILVFCDFIRAWDPGGATVVGNRKRLQGGCRADICSALERRYP